MAATQSPINMGVARPAADPRRVRPGPGSRRPHRRHSGPMMPVPAVMQLLGRPTAGCPAGSNGQSRTSRSSRSWLTFQLAAIRDPREVRARCLVA
jgi:hypothetical protein